MTKTFDKPMTNYCSLCHDTLLRHIRHCEVYWFCPSCRQEMPKESDPSPSINPVEHGLLSEQIVLKV